MKKILILTSILVLSATISYAAGGSSDAGTITFATSGLELHGSSTAAAATADTALIGKNSTGVDVAWKTSTAGYALMTQHKSGTKAYGSSYDSTALFQTIVDVDPLTPAYNSGVLAATDTTDFSDTAKWKAM